jgi:hypothetical protein
MSELPTPFDLGVVRGSQRIARMRRVGECMKEPSKETGIMHKFGEKVSMEKKERGKAAILFLLLHMCMEASRWPLAGGFEAPEGIGEWEKRS